MLVDGTRADDAAAGQGDFRLTVTRKQRAQQIVRSAHAADRLAERFGGGQRTRIDAHAVAFGIADGNAELLKDFLEALDVLNMRQVLEDASFARENCSRYDGYGRVFRAADGYGSFEPFPANDFIILLLHTMTSLAESPFKVKRRQTWPKPFAFDALTASILHKARFFSVFQLRFMPCCAFWQAFFCKRIRGSLQNQRILPACIIFQDAAKYI
ncbi:hypothetical protein SDC9_108107 [bioreactor metagenome]|uniref:Uncharacterized protein n=1 Tax=bioreactor metagenome TaxID=1076179 RepID=A0A645B707_9ZZZZ